MHDFGLDEARAFVEKARWHEAVTWRDKAPHEYILRHECARAGRLDEFVAFGALIMSQGYDRPWGGALWTSLNIGEHYYWTAGVGRNSPADRATVINRALRDPEQLSFD